MTPGASTKSSRAPAVCNAIADKASRVVGLVERVVRAGDLHNRRNCRQAMLSRFLFTAQRRKYKSWKIIRLIKMKKNSQNALFIMKKTKYYFSTLILFIFLKNTKNDFFCKFYKKNGKTKLKIILQNYILC